MVLSFRSRPLCGLELELPPFDLVGMLPVSIGKSRLCRNKELHSAESAAGGVNLLYEFSPDTSGYLDMLQPLRKAGVPKAHAYIAGDLRRKMVAR